MDELSYERVTTARGGHMRKHRGRSLRRHGEGQTPEDTQGWRHAFGRRDTPEGLWPVEDSHQGRTLLRKCSLLVTHAGEQQ